MITPYFAVCERSEIPAIPPEEIAGCPFNGEEFEIQKGRGIAQTHVAS